MKIERWLCAVALVTWSAAACPAVPVPVVSQVHVVSVHVRDRAAFDAVFLLFKDALQLPLVYGELSKPGNETRTLYAGFSVGNAYLEPCYKSDAPYPPGQSARFHGLTFSPATSMTETVSLLGPRGLTYSGPFGGGDRPLFVYLSDPMLTGELLTASLWEIQNKQDRVNLRFLGSALEQAKGGALGLKRLAEVRIGHPESNQPAQWTRLLRPATQKNAAWVLGIGPRLRFVPAKEPQIESILLQVESLEKARVYLRSKGLVGTENSILIELDPAKTLGLRIQLLAN